MLLSEASIQNLMLADGEKLSVSEANSFRTYFRVYFAVCPLVCSRLITIPIQSKHYDRNCFGHAENICMADLCEVAGADNSSVGSYLFSSLAVFRAHQFGFC